MSEIFVSTIDLIFDNYFHLNSYDFVFLTQFGCVFLTISRKLVLHSDFHLLDNQQNVLIPPSMNTSAKVTLNKMSVEMVQLWMVYKHAEF